MPGPLAIQPGTGRPARPLAIALAALALVAAVCIPSTSHAVSSMSNIDKLLSVYGGLFTPSGDYADEYDSIGLNLGGSLIRVDQYAGFEMGFTTYYAKAPDLDADAYAFGIEAQPSRKSPRVAEAVDALLATYWP